MRSFIRLSLALPLAGLLCASAHAQSAGLPVSVASPTPSAVPKVVLTEGTEVKLSLLKELKSGGQKVGEIIPFEVERDVYSPFPSHVLLLPAGTPAFGHVTHSSRRGMLGKPGKLDFTCDYVRALDGVHVPLRADKASNRGRSNAGANVVAVLLFAPGYLLINGRDISVHKGTEFVAFSDEAVAITDPRGPGALTADTPQTIASPVMAAAVSASQTKTLFTMKDGTQLVGALAGSDGTVYMITTATGSQNINVADVASMHALAALPAAPTAVAPATPPVVVTAAPVPPAPAPRLPVITTFPQKVRMELNNGNSYFGSVTAFDGAAYTLTTSSATMTLNAADVKTLELQQ